MNSGDRKNYIYLPRLGIIEAGEALDDAVERINRAEVAREIAEKKLLRKLKRRFPNSSMGSWFIDPI